MNKFFFLKNIDYKFSKQTRLNKNLLNEAYLRTKKTMTKILKNNSILNIVVEENNSQTKKFFLTCAFLYVDCTLAYQLKAEAFGSGAETFSSKADAFGSKINYLI